jgi:flagellar basal-body rod protein FlgB
MLDLVQRALDASSLSHSVIANNIANVDTPGFKRSEVVFNEQLKSAIQARQNESSQLGLATTDPRHIALDGVPALSSIQPKVTTDLSSSLRNDGNNVDIDTEVSLLAQNTVWYQTLSQITQHQFAQTLDAITDNVK